MNDESGEVRSEGDDVKNYYLGTPETRRGPYTEGEIRRRLEEHMISEDDPCWREGMKGWATVAVVLPQPPVFYMIGGPKAPRGPYTAQEVGQRLEDGEISLGTLCRRGGVAEWKTVGDCFNIEIKSQKSPLTPSGSELNDSRKTVAAPPLLLAIHQAQSKATASLICGIVSVPVVFLGLILGAVAVVLGSAGLKTLRAANIREGQRSAKAGRLLGWIAIGWQTLWVLMVLVVLPLLRQGIQRSFDEAQRQIETEARARQ